MCSRSAAWAIAAPRATGNAVPGAVAPADRAAAVVAGERAVPSAGRRVAHGARPLHAPDGPVRGGRVLPVLPAAFGRDRGGAAHPAGGRRGYRARDGDRPYRRVRAALRVRPRLAPVCTAARRTAPGCPDARRSG